MLWYVFTYTCPRYLVVVLHKSSIMKETGVTCRSRLTHIDNLAQNCSNSIANTLELLQPCAKPSTYSLEYFSIIASHDGLSHVWCQVIILTNTLLFSNGRLGRKFTKILNETERFSYNEMSLKMSSAKWPPLYFGLNVLTVWLSPQIYSIKVDIMQIACCHTL